MNVLLDGSVTIETLTQKLMAPLVDKIVAIDSECIDEMGVRFCTFPWNRENYLLDLKGKWELSQVAHRLRGDIAGVWVVSNTVEDTCHTHRVIVSKKYRGKGIAKGMFERVLNKTREMGLNNMTIEISCLNQPALAFYKKLGFAAMQGGEIEAYLKSRGRNARVFSDCLQEDDGSRYYVYKRSLV